MIQTILSTALPIDEKLQIKKNRISNGTGKKRICIVTGTHGDELEGQYVCYELIQKLNKEIDFLDGTVDIYPALNPLGIDSITRGIPGFDLDLNRIFPGDPNGTMAEIMASAIYEDLKGADMVIDIHSSNIFLREIPQVRINVNDAEKLVPFAKLLNVDFIWIHEAATVLEATLAHSLNSIGTPTLVAEMGVGMRINHKLGSQLLDGIFNLMNSMEIWSGKIDTEKLINPVISSGDDVSFINAEASGVFLTESKNDTMVYEGQEIGKIVNTLTGETLQTVCATTNGMLFTLRAYPVVYQGSLLARIHKL